MKASMQATSGDRLEFCYTSGDVIHQEWQAGDIKYPSEAGRPGLYPNDGSMYIRPDGHPIGAWPIRIECGTYRNETAPGRGWAFEQQGGDYWIYIRPIAPLTMTDLLTKWGC